MREQPKNSEAGTCYHCNHIVLKLKQTFPSPLLPFCIPRVLGAQMVKLRLAFRNFHSPELHGDVNELSLWSAVLCVFAKNTGTDTTHLLPLLPQHYFFHLFEFWLL